MKIVFEHGYMNTRLAQFADKIPAKNRASPIFEIENNYSKNMAQIISVYEGLAFIQELRREVKSIGMQEGLSLGDRFAKIELLDAEIDKLVDTLCNQERKTLVIRFEKINVNISTKHISPTRSVKMLKSFWTVSHSDWKLLPKKVQDCRNDDYKSPTSIVLNIPGGDPDAITRLKLFLGDTAAIKNVTVSNMPILDVTFKI